MRDQDNRLTEPFTIEEAAEFITEISGKITPAGVAYHVYQTKKLVPDLRLGRAVLFSKTALVKFAVQRERRGPKLVRAIRKPLPKKWK
jgi:hypothetical protein